MNSIPATVDVFWSGLLVQPWDLRGNLLRYPGGKFRARQAVLPYFPLTPGRIASPFFGGGPIEIALAARGWQVYGYDAFEPLVDFWRETITDAPLLASAVEDFHPLDKETFRRLQSANFNTPFERAVAFYVLNRSSFSGSTWCGGMSPGCSRFTPSSIQRLRNFETGELWVDWADFRDSIPSHPDELLFLDPPYMTAKKLYGLRGDLHDNFDHQTLRDLLSNRDQWILCYDDCPQSRLMYAGYKIIPLHWKYGMSRHKHSREILILSQDLASAASPMMWTGSVE